MPLVSTDIESFTGHLVICQDPEGACSEEDPLHPHHCCSSLQLDSSAGTFTNPPCIFEFLRAAKPEHTKEFAHNFFGGDVHPIYNIQLGFSILGGDLCVCVPQG